jgi:RNA polymerase sigma-70 factor (ECF subfamily)
MLTDSELDDIIRRCQHEERTAQAALYRQFSGVIFGVCLKYAKNYEEAQDHLQDGFLHAFAKINQFGFKGSFEGWLKRLVINRILLSYRKKPYFEIVQDHDYDEIDVDFDVEQIDLQLDDLLAMIQELPDRYRLVFNLYVMDQYSHQEIADLLDITVGTSKSNLSRARASLKQKIEAILEKKNNNAVGLGRNASGFIS